MIPCWKIVLQASPGVPVSVGLGLTVASLSPFTWGFEGPEPAIPNLSMPTEQANHLSDLCSLRWRTGCPRQGILPRLLSSLISEGSGCTQDGLARPGLFSLCLDATSGSFPGPLFPCTGRRMCKNLNSFRLLFLSSQSCHVGRVGGAELWSFGSTKH